MKVLVCGGRNYSDKDRVFQVLDEIHEDGDVLQIEVIIHGAASGADRLAGEWAEARDVECVEYPAFWAKHGKAAGPIRNQEMLDQEKPDLVVAFPGGKGTADMIGRAKAAGIPVDEID